MQYLLLWLLIFFLPTQLGQHFWPQFTYVSGFPIDYLSPTLYLTDLIIFSYLVFSFSKIKKTFTKLKLKKTTLFFLVFILINTLFSQSPFPTFFSWFRLLIYLVLFLAFLSQPQLKKNVLLPFTISLLLIIFIQLSQLVSQSSLNGLFYFLGERHFNLSTPHLAKIDLSFLCQYQTFFCSVPLLLRPYSIFSHPNSLAGYLLLAFLIINTYPSFRFKKTLKLSLSLSLALTFSKAAIFALIILLFSFNKKTLKIIIITFLLLSLAPLTAPLYLKSFNSQPSLLTRLYLGLPAVKIIKTHLLFGTGYKNYISVLPKFLSPAHLTFATLQPIHSLPLLFLAELGLSGFFLLYLFIKKITKRFISFLSNSIPFLQFLSIVTITSAFDHYWWTLPQNQLILILALALLLQPYYSKYFLKKQPTKPN